MEKISEHWNTFLTEMDQTSSSSNSTSDVQIMQHGGGAATNLMQQYEKHRLDIYNRKFSSQSKDRVKWRESVKTKNKPGLKRIFTCEFAHKKIPNRLCGYKTADRGNMKTHLNIHCNENQFICHICFSAFNQRQNLKIHYSKIHPENIPDAFKIKSVHSQKKTRGRKPLGEAFAFYVNQFLMKYSYESINFFLFKITFLI